MTLRMKNSFACSERDKNVGHQGIVSAWVYADTFIGVVIKLQNLKFKCTGLVHVYQLWYILDGDWIARIIFELTQKKNSQNCKFLWNMSSTCIEYRCVTPFDLFTQSDNIFMKLQKMSRNTINSFLWPLP